MASNLRILRQAGAALYGNRWQSDMSRLLGVSFKTIQRWDREESPVPPLVMPTLRRALEKQRDRVAATLAALPVGERG